jgi:hypothetical protein
MVHHGFRVKNNSSRTGSRDGSRDGAMMRDGCNFVRDLGIMRLCKEPEGSAIEELYRFHEHARSVPPSGKKTGRNNNFRDANTYLKFLFACFIPSTP